MLYLRKVLDSRPRGLAMAAVFAVLYGLLYLMPGLEDYALLAGALLGFAARHRHVRHAPHRLVRRRRPRCLHARLTLTADHWPAENGRCFKSICEGKKDRTGNA